MKILNGCLTAVAALGAGVILAVGVTLWGGWFVLWAFLGAAVLTILGAVVLGLIAEPEDTE